MRFLVTCAVAAALWPCSLYAQSADLPNADLPGNSPTLPNSNLPGSMPTANPVTLPNSDTSRAVIDPWSPQVFPPDANVPERNPTHPIPVEERTPTLQQQLQDSQAQTAAAQKEAQQAREDAAAARDEAAAARDEAQAAKEDAAKLERTLDEKEAAQKGKTGGTTTGAQPPVEEAPVE